MNVRVCVIGVAAFSAAAYTGAQITINESHSGRCVVVGHNQVRDCTAEELAKDKAQRAAEMAREDEERANEEAEEARDEAEQVMEEADQKREEAEQGGEEALEMDDTDADAEDFDEDWDLEIAEPPRPSAPVRSAAPPQPPRLPVAAQRCC